MINGIGVVRARSTHFERNHVKTVDGLSFKEKEILGEIRDKVSSEFPNIPVTIDLGNKSSCGKRTIFMQGNFMLSGNSITFVINPNMLKEMAEDKDKYREYMSRIQDQIQKEQENQRKFAQAKKQYEQEEVERKSQRIKINMMSVFDFLNKNKGESQARAQPVKSKTMQSILNRYEQALPEPNVNTKFTTP